jgi:dienelactone hydrolase
MRRCYLLMMVCALALAAHAQTPAPETPTPGVVHASVAVTADPTNSYALYLPSAYTAAKQWPLLLAFDPGGRGEVPVKLFHDAAEKYGFIVAGSNNSRNFENPANAVRLLGQDVEDRYSIDRQRVYVAGLSGGARVATSIAVNCKTCIAGVIANGAGLPSSAPLPGPEVSDWFLVAGTTDFNYPELLHLKEALDARNAVSRFVVYDGPHTWMPPEFAEQALAWLQLRAMVKGLTSVDKNFVNQQFEQRLAQAQTEQKNGDILAAVRAYRAIATDFKTFRDVKDQEATAKTLAGSDAFRKAKKNEAATLELQDTVAKKAGDLVAGISERPDERADFFEQLESAVSETYRQQKGASNLAQKQAITRGLASAFAFAVENGQKAMLKKDYASAKEMFRACETIQPDSPWASYLLASADAELGEKKPAVEALKKALKKGMTSAKALDDSAFDRIRDDKDFQQIVASLANAKKNETAR